MAIIRITQPQMVTQEIYEAVNAKMGVDANPPGGLLLHCAGEVEGRWQIVDVWESEQHAQRFDSERLVPAIEAVVGSPPQGPPTTTTYELHNLVMP